MQYTHTRRPCHCIYMRNMPTLKQYAICDNTYTDDTANIVPYQPCLVLVYVMFTLNWKCLWIRENFHQVGSILFVTNFIIPQLAILLTSTFQPSSAAFFRNWMFSGHCSLDGVASRLSHTWHVASSDHWTFSFWRRPLTAVEMLK